MKKYGNFGGLKAFWGNLSLDANPVGKNNIMYTGFCATQTALFQAATGDNRFSELGAFSLNSKNGESWNADFGSLCDNLDTQYSNSKYGLIAREPNWVFPGCNAIGFIGRVR